MIFESRNPDPIVSVRHLTKSFGDHDVLKDIDLTLGDGELVCLLGVSGGGKTTLFNIISGLNKPQSGRVLLGGEDITGQTGKVSYMLQKDMLLPYRTVEDNVALPMIIRGMKKKGALLQINAYSIANEMNAQIREIANSCLAERLVDFIGSDAHRLKH